MSKADAELERACLELALAIKSVAEPVSSHQVRGLAEQYVTIAKLHTSEPPLHIDVPLITRAVRYLTQVHAIPPMGDDTEWFENMLSAVLEIARPNSRLDDQGREFLKDLLQGIRMLIEEDAES